MPVAMVDECEIAGKVKVLLRYLVALIGDQSEAFFFFHFPFSIFQMPNSFELVTRKLDQEIINGKKLHNFD